MADIVISLNPKNSGVLLLQCPFFANELVKDIPGRRWSKHHQAWAVPIGRFSIEHIHEKMRGLTKISEDAEAAMRAYLDAEAAMKSTGEWPTWFKFKTKPRDHQLRCLKHIYPRGPNALHMDRGTGKTKTVIDMAAARRMENKIDCLLVIAKLSLRKNWVQEFLDHCAIPADVHLPISAKPEQFRRWLRTRHDFKVMIVGIESLSAGGMFDLCMEFLKAHKKPMMAIDETHHIATHKAIRSERCVKLAERCLYRTAMTGTPISTGPMNLFMQYEYLDPKIIGIGDFYAFRNRYAIMGGYTDQAGRPMQIVGYQNLEELTALVAPYTFQCLKSEVLDLPPKVYKRYHVELSAEQRRLYDIVRREDVVRLKGRDDHVIQNVLELALRLHQIAGGYTIKASLDAKGKPTYEPVEIVPWERNPKIVEIRDILRLDPVPCIIWCAYMPEILAVQRMLKAEFPEHRAELLIRGTEQHNWDIVQDFQAGKIRFLVSNVATGGTGHNMTAAEMMIYYSNTNKLVDRLQSEDRAHREGLTHSVLYIDLIAEKTVDVSIIKSNERKQNLSDYVRSRIGELSAVLAGED